MLADRTWVESLRAEALAKLFLTRRNDLVVIPVQVTGHRLGYELLVLVQQPGTSDQPEFAVRLNGLRGGQLTPATLQRLRSTPNVMGSGGRPIVLFVFDVDAERGQWTWLAKPSTDSTNDAVLRASSGLRATAPVAFDAFQELTDASIEQIVRQVVAWHRDQQQTVSRPTEWRAATG